MRAQNFPLHGRAGRVQKAVIKIPEVVEGR